MLCPSFPFPSPEMLFFFDSPPQTMSPLPLPPFLCMDFLPFRGPCGWLGSLKRGPVSSTVVGFFFEVPSFMPIFFSLPFPLPVLFFPFLRVLLSFFFLSEAGLSPTQPWIGSRLAFPLFSFFSLSPPFLGSSPQRVLIGFKTPSPFVVL